MTTQRQDYMRTYRLVVDTPKGACAVDIVLRGQAPAIAQVGPDVLAWLNGGIGYAGVWADKGTFRDTFNIAVDSRERK